MIERHRHAQRQAAADAVDELRAALAGGDIVLPSLGVDHQSPFTGVVLVELGCARPDVVRQMARAIRRGTAATARADD
ncbi:hypothetical protein [Kitasatospora nipponensis]